MFQQNGYLSLDLGSGKGEFMRLREGWRQSGVTTLEDIVERVVLESPEADALSLELESFIRAARGESETTVTGAEGRSALALALRVSGAVQRPA